MPTTEIYGDEFRNPAAEQEENIVARLRASGLQSSSIGGSFGGGGSPSIPPHDHEAGGDDNIDYFILDADTLDQLDDGSRILLDDYADGVRFYFGR